MRHDRQRFDPNSIFEWNFGGDFIVQLDYAAPFFKINRYIFFPNTDSVINFQMESNH